MLQRSLHRWLNPDCRRIHHARIHRWELLHRRHDHDINFPKESPPTSI